MIDRDQARDVVTRIARGDFGTADAAVDALRMTDTTPTGPDPTLLETVAIALRHSAAVHAAERIPHLVPALLALADAVEAATLDTGPRPGRCGQPPPAGPEGISCNLRSGHAGQHETPWRDGIAYWGDVTPPHADGSTER